MGNKSNWTSNKTKEQPQQEESRVSKQGEEQAESQRSSAGLTHGFWLQQYSWLHNDDHQRDTKCHLANRRQQKRPQKLMARWRSGLLRTFASLSSSHDDVNVRPKSEMPTARRRFWFASAGTSTDKLAAKSKAACYSTLNLPTQVSSVARASSRSSLLLAVDDADIDADTNKMMAASSSVSLSPYRRLARALRSPSKQAAKRTEKADQSSSGQSGSRLVRLAHWSSSAAAAHAGGQTQVPADAADSQGRQQTTGLLSSILISPLFRSRARHQSRGEQSERAHSDKRQKSLDKRAKKSSEIRSDDTEEASSSKCCRLGIEGRRADQNYDRSRTDAGASSNRRHSKIDKGASGYLAHANELPAEEQEAPASSIRSSRSRRSSSSTSSQLQSLTYKQNNELHLDCASGEQVVAAKSELTGAESSLLALIQATPIGGSSSSLASSSMIYLDQSNEATPRRCTRTTTFAGDQDCQSEQADNDEDGDDDDDDEHGDEHEQPVQVAQLAQAMGARDLEQQRAVSQPVGERCPPVTPVSTPKETREPPSNGVGGSLKNNFKKLIKRQQSVDSYRMARDLKNKLRRQNEARNKHQSNEAIKTKSVGDEQLQQPSASHSHQANGASSRQRQQQSFSSIVSQNRKFSMLTDLRGAFNPFADQQQQQQQHQSGDSLCHSTIQQQQQQPIDSSQLELRQAAASLRISIDPYAKPGTFELPGASEMGSSIRETGRKELDSKPTPPSTLNLMPSSNQVGFSASSFSGCITPTYPTHHLPSPKYVSSNMMAANKKYSNASTISSSGGGESLMASGALANCHSSAGSFQGRGLTVCSTNQTTSDTTTTTNNNNNSSNKASTAVADEPDLSGSQERQQQLQQSDAENTSGSASPLRSIQQQLLNRQQPQSTIVITGRLDGSASSERLAAARRANLAEHIYDNKCGLGEDMKFLASLPELCDITFLVGETREPVCAVKSVLAARSRVFSKILFGNQMRAFNRQQQQQQSNQRNSEADLMWAPDENLDRRSSSPKPGARLALTNNRSSSPVASARSVSPKQQQQSALQHWSVTTDASGYAQPSALDLNHRQQQQQRRESLERSAGRSSVVSTGTSLMGRESAISQLSQTSQGSQQPLIIGPGQTATPAPMQLISSASSSSSPGRRNKRATLARDSVTVSGPSTFAAPTGSGSGLGSSVHASKQLDRQHSREGGPSRLSRMFMKRASDPSIKQQQQLSGSNQNYLDKMSSSQMSTTMIIEEFEPDVFRQLIEYIHTGCVLLQARTLLGLLNAADYYGLEQLRKACLRFVSCCITVDTVCSLLSTAERYIQYKCTKSIVQKVLEFVDTHADEIFKLNAFGLLPEHVVRLILARDGLQADEQAKYNGVYTWCEHYCRSYELTNIADVMGNFLDFIQFHKIPTNILLSEIYPTHTVPDTIFLSALAYQADPKNLEPQPLKARRMTLPNPTFHKDQSGDELNDNDDRSATAAAQPEQQEQQQQELHETPPALGSGTGRPVIGASFSSSWSRESKSSRRKSNQSQSQLQQQQQQRQASRDSISSGQHSLLQQAAALQTSSVGRKSLGGQQQQSGNRAPPIAQARARKGSIAQVSISGVMRLSHKLSIKRRAARGDSLVGGGHSRRPSALSKQQSLLSSSGRSGSAANDVPDPLRLGQQILDAYLEQQRQRELEEAQRKRREAERRASEQAAIAAGSSAQPAEQVQLTKQPIVKVSLSTRKSFKDFKHISRRIFMRRSSSNKMVQQQQRQQQWSIAAGPSCSSSSGVNFGPGASPGAGEQPQPQPQQPQQQHQQQQLAQTKESQSSLATKRRNVLKIKRSETVFETRGPGQSLGSRLSHQLSATMLGK